jgi:integrase
MIVTDLADHLDQHAQDGDDGLIFTSPEGASLRHGNFTRRVWLPAVGKAGLPGVHFHDLRHAGNHYTATAGANLRELMERMGHSTSRAAMIYLHSTDPRQRALADAVDKAARDELRQARKWPPRIGEPAQDNSASGTEVARDREQDS